MAGDGKSVRLPLPGVEVGLLEGADNTLPLPGAPTEKLKIIDERRDQKSLSLTLEAPGSTSQSLVVRQNDPRLHVSADGGTLSEKNTRLEIKFPAGPGYQQQKITLRW